MATRGIPDELLRDDKLIKELEAVGKDSALLHGVLMRTKETPNSSEVNILNFLFLSQCYVLKCTWIEPILKPQHWFTVAEMLHN